MNAINRIIIEAARNARYKKVDFLGGFGGSLTAAYLATNPLSGVLKGVCEEFFKADPIYSCTPHEFCVTMQWALLTAGGGYLGYQVADKCYRAYRTYAQFLFGRNNNPF